MLITKKIKPGQAGAKKLLNKYGDKLFCVRYRYDLEKKKKYKTAEIKIYEEEWNPKSDKRRNNNYVYLKVLYGEADVGRAIKNAGGIWDKKKKLWKLRYKHVIDLNLQQRVVKI